jgi:hypothetical protein
MSGSGQHPTQHGKEIRDVFLMKSMKRNWVKKFIPLKHETK